MQGPNNIARQLDVLPMRERRRSIRYASRLVTRIHTRTKSDRIGVSWNLSCVGAAVLTSSRLNIGERATLEFPLDADPANVISLEGRVVRLQVNHDAEDIWSRFECGIEFFEPLEPDLLCLLLDSADVPQLTT